MHEIPSIKLWVFLFLFSSQAWAHEAHTTAIAAAAAATTVMVVEVFVFDWRDMGGIWIEWLYLPNKHTRRKKVAECRISFRGIHNWCYVVCGWYFPFLSLCLPHTLSFLSPLSFDSIVVCSFWFICRLMLFVSFGVSAILSHRRFSFFHKKCNHKRTHTRGIFRSVFQNPLWISFRVLIQFCFSILIHSAFVSFSCEILPFDEWIESG